MKKLSIGQDSTLGNWRNLCAATFGPYSAPTVFLENKIKESPNGEEEEVLADERQLLHVLGNMYIEEIHQQEGQSEVARKSLKADSYDPDTQGWHYNQKFNLYQKVAGRVFVYVSPLLFNQYKVQLYMRGFGEMGVCKLELRANNRDRLEDLYHVGDLWLDKYKSGDLDLIDQDFYSVSNPEGVWEKTEEKLYWI
ncbi:hypothetical protein [Paenibacillus sp. LBL]|uniref:hypothetical protein n=1 Tax=Paenibacillus sp. LBL TaxID=2940563 RepID=UPI002476BF79|nr:hypothetical protein [Paenibacillus sp. LBL]